MSGHWELRVSGYEPGSMGRVYWSRRYLFRDTTLVDAVHSIAGVVPDFVEDMEITEASHHTFTIV